MKVDKEFLKSTVNFIVNQQIAHRRVSPQSAAGLAVDLVLTLLSVESDDSDSDVKAVPHPQQVCRKVSRLIPAVPIEDSVQDDYIVCLEDGMRFCMLKRHIWEKYELTPEEYRIKWGLPYDYPMVAPAYSRRKGEIARKLNFGRYPRR